MSSNVNLYILQHGAEHTLVEKQFRNGWKHPNKPMPRVQAIFRVVMPEESVKPYKNYRTLVQASLPSKKQHQLEEFRFHGTPRACLLGENDPNPSLCALAECCLCSIARNSFDISNSGISHKFRRFGRGIYTTSCSSKADDYSSNLHQNAQLRVLILSRVVVGKAKKVRKNQTHLTGVSPPYDSIIGEPGEHLNYEESCVYSNDAIRPAYLIIYGNATRPGSDS